MQLLELTCVLIAICNCITRAKCDNEDLQPHRSSKIECDGRRMQLNRYMKEVTCVPKLTHEKLIPERGYTFYPNYVLVNKCGGFCPNSKSCLPVKTNFKNVTVRRYRKENHDSRQCYRVSVEEHVKCTCACSVMEYHCNEHHVYSEDNCTCECMNRTECDESRQMVWDEKTCKCVCNKSEEICASGLEWLPSRCKCVKVMEMDTPASENTT